MIQHAHSTHDEESFSDMTIDALREQLRQKINTMHYEARLQADCGFLPKQYRLDVRPVLQPYLALFHKKRFTSRQADGTQETLLFPLDHLFLPRVVLSGLDLTDVSFEGSTLDDADLSECVLRHVTLTRASCQRTIFARAAWDTVSCLETNFRGANWDATMIARTSFLAARAVRFETTTLFMEATCQTLLEHHTLAMSLPSSCRASSSSTIPERKHLTPVPLPAASPPPPFPAETPVPKRQKGQDREQITEGLDIAVLLAEIETGITLLSQKQRALIEAQKTECSLPSVSLVPSPPAPGRTRVKESWQDVVDAHMKKPLYIRQQRHFFSELYTKWKGRFYHVPRTRAD